MILTFDGGKKSTWKEIVHEYCCRDLIALKHPRWQLFTNAVINFIQASFGAETSLNSPVKRRHVKSKDFRQERECKRDDGLGWNHRQCVGSLISVTKRILVVRSVGWQYLETVIHEVAVIFVVNHFLRAAKPPSSFWSSNSGYSENDRTNFGKLIQN